MSDLHVGGGLGHTLGKQVGPLPLGAWAVAIIGGVGVAYYINRRQAAAAANDAIQSAADPSASAAYQEGAQGGPGNDTPAGVGNTGNAPLPPQDGPIRTNAQWRVAAIRALIVAGNPPLASANAVQRYLAGKPLNHAQQGLVNQAIGLVGPPPQNTRLSPLEPAHHPQHSPAHHPKHHKHHQVGPHHHGGHRLHRVRPGDTLGSIAAAHGTTADALATANQVRTVRPGQMVKVPAPPTVRPAPPHAQPYLHTRRDTGRQ